MVNYAFRYRKNPIYDAHQITKFGIFISYLPLIFIFTNPIYLIIIFTNLVSYALFARDGKKCLTPLKFTIYLGVFLILINSIIRNDGNSVIIHVGFIKVSLETIILSFVYVIQLLLVILLFSLINALINPDKLMESFMKIRIFPQSIVLILLLSIRFFPLLMTDLNEIQDIQRTRGVELDKGNFLTRMKNKIKIILPLLSTSLERSIEFSEALETRGFGLTEKRTFLNQKKLNFLDYFTLVFQFSLMIVILAFNIIHDAGLYDPFPKISPLPFTMMDFLLIISLLLGNVLEICLIYLNNREDVNDRIF